MSYKETMAYLMAVKISYVYRYQHGSEDVLKANIKTKNETQL